MTTITLPRATVEQALEAMRRAVPTGKITLYEWDKAVSDLNAALAQQAEPHRDLRAALAQQRLTDAQQEMERSIESLKAALAQQAEPVQDLIPPESLFVCDQMGAHVTRVRLAQQAEPDHETRAELAEQQVVQLAEERDHYRNLWQKAQKAESADVVGLLEYRGNSVAFIYQKMTAYSSGIEAAWDAFRAKELHPDGKTSLADMIAKHTAPPQRKPLMEEEIQVAWDSVDMRHPRGNETRIAFARAVERAHGIKE